MKISNYINHIVFVIDASASMYYLRSSVVKVFDNQIKHLAEKSKELDQETRVSIYFFSSSVNNAVYDKDVLRLPSLEYFYRTGGMTRLIDGSIQAIEDLKKTPELYGDHSHLVYVISDGQENSSRNRPEKLQEVIKSLAKNWTLAYLAPNKQAKSYAVRLGFPDSNVKIWDATSAQGVEKIGLEIKQSTDNYMQARTTGLRSTDNLFDLKKPTVAKVKKELKKLKASDFSILNVKKESQVKPFVKEVAKKKFFTGCAFYELTKPEKVQVTKKIIIQNKKDKSLYGGDNARALLGLPDHEVRVAPASFDDWNIFCQSTSVNRKLKPGSKLVLQKKLVV